MTRIEQLIKRRGELDKLLDAVRKAILEIVETGAASASISSGGGSKSYSHLSLSELRVLERETCEKKAAVNRLIGGNGGVLRRVMIVR